MSSRAVSSRRCCSSRAIPCSLGRALQLVLQCAISSCDSGEARNTLDDCISMLQALPPAVRADIMSADLVSALKSSSPPSSSPPSSSPPSSFGAHAASALEAAGLFASSSSIPLPSFDALPPVSATSSLHGAFSNTLFVCNTEPLSPTFVVSKKQT